MIKFNFFIYKYLIQYVIGIVNGIHKWPAKLRVKHLILIICDSKILIDVLYFLNIFIIENSLILTVQEIVQNICEHTNFLHHFFRNYSKKCFASAKVQPWTRPVRQWNLIYTQRRRIFSTTKCFIRPVSTTYLM